MLSKEKGRWLLAGGLAGLVNGFFGGGGGSVLVRVAMICVEMRLLSLVR